MIYILEDDDSIRKLVTYALESQGYEAAGFAVPSAFYRAMKGKQPSLLLLDIMLPEEDGISILRKLRADPLTAHLPVIMLTAKSTEYDHVEGLDAGADDYVAKPFGMMELLARVRAVLRRAEAAGTIGDSDRFEDKSAETPGTKEAGTKAAGKTEPAAGGVSGLPLNRETASTAPALSGGSLVSDQETGTKADAADADSRRPSDAETRDEDAARAQRTSGHGDEILKYGILRIYPRRYEVYVEDTEITLTNKEYQLLLLLVENEGIVLTREVLLDRIWDLGSEPENRTLDVHIRKIRSKLGEAAMWIETIRGVGYRFRPGN